MRVHFHSTAATGRWAAALRALERVVPPESLHLYRSLPPLLEGLPESGPDDLVVILVGTDDELAALEAATEALSDRRLLLVVHDARPETFARGHRLRPRILLAPPLDPDLISGIVGKMVGAPGTTHRPTPPRHGPNTGGSEE